MRKWKSLVFLRICWLMSDLSLSHAFSHHCSGKNAFMSSAARFSCCAKRFSYFFLTCEMKSLWDLIQNHPLWPRYLKEKQNKYTWTVNRPKCFVQTMVFHPSLNILLTVWMNRQLMCTHTHVERDLPISVHTAAVNSFQWPQWLPHDEIGLYQGTGCLSPPL